MNSQPISLLFGSGVSLHSGLPTTNTITQQVQSGLNVHRHTDGSYYISQDDYTPYCTKDFLPSVLRLVQWINCEFSQYYELLGRSVNHEDIYYAVCQLHDHEHGEYENPIVIPFIDKIKKHPDQLLGNYPYPTDKEWRVIDLTREVQNYIKDIVWELVSKQPDTTEQFGLIDTIAQDDKFGIIEVFTLNHDLIFEQHCQDNGLSLEDGFGELRDEVRPWEPDRFSSTQSKLRLYKLHGSIDWFRYREEQKLVKTASNDIWHTKDQEQRFRLPVSGRPEILVGSFNKIFEYNQPEFFELQMLFYSALRKSDWLIVSGYSFGDKIVNQRVIQWLYQSKQSRMVIVHPDRTALKSGARPAVSRSLDTWIDTGKVVFIEKLFEDCNPNEVLVD